jgi:hypothetical protein
MAMSYAKVHLMAALMFLALAGVGRAQDVTVVPPKGSPQPAFSNNPEPAPPAEFCPAGKTTTRNIVYPFAPDEEKMCPTGNAFSNPCEKIPGGLYTPKCYGSLGFMALSRYSLNSTQIASIAPAVGFTSASPVDIQSVPIRFNPGIRGEVGVVALGGAIELSGFYIFDFPVSSTATPNKSHTGPITVFFANHPAPAGFNPALWTNASQVTTNYSITTGSAELNYRLPFAQGLDFLFGVRYFNVNENISIDTVAPLGTTDYAIGVKTQLVGPQLGFEWEQVLVPHFSISMLGKGALCGAFADVSHSLTEGNGAVGPGGSTQITQVGEVFELGAFAHVWFNERFKLRVGYEAFWVLNIPEAQQQISANTNLPLGAQQYHGSIFYHGPTLEFQLAF